MGSSHRCSIQARVTIGWNTRTNVYARCRNVWFHDAAKSIGGASAAETRNVIRDIYRANAEGFREGTGGGCGVTSRAAIPNGKRGKNPRIEPGLNSGAKESIGPVVSSPRIINYVWT